ncbi:MAG: hypothetical protein EBU81_01720, partial [Proteobacteria bacterium]|nr:hypothetical protein [Pseudomonadota bacterium]
MLQGQQFVERIGRRDHPKLTRPQTAIHLEDQDRHGLTLRGEGRTIAHDDRHHAVAGAAGAQRIGVDGGVVIGDFRHGRDAHSGPFLGIRHVLARDVRVLDEGVH